MALPPLPSLSIFPFSSEARSSSPPMTPSSSTSYYYPYIHSSPMFACDIHPMSEESFFSSRHRLPRLGSSPLPHTSNFHPKRDFSPPTCSMPIASPETDDENDGEGTGYDFTAEPCRSTFFMISAERGRWKTDPIPRKFSRHTCKSEPMPASISPPRPPSRLLSEPVPSDLPNFMDDPPDSEKISSLKMEPELPASDPSEPLLRSDVDRDDNDGPAPSSPLPPSSPPLSPMSPCSSPLSPSPLLPSSPLSSPVSEQTSLEEDSMTSDFGVLEPERPDLVESILVMEPSAKRHVDVTTKAVLGPRENVCEERRRGAERSWSGDRKRKEYHSGLETSKKKRRIEVGSSQSKGTGKKASQKESCPQDENRSQGDSEDEEIRGMLIESMALSRASSHPVSVLCKSVMQARPAMKAERGEKEWMSVFLRVLEGGVAGRGSGLFGKVESSGKDDRGRPLEPQWFYVPEMDEDQERAALIKSMMPRPGKRNETKKYKQYYYRPLHKLSRWDLEDS
ncbi:hypothetical protein APHAL10511_007782 [Amanita phalloides]|nr:hypothetical protein APHAL10511_007782 [Amanita phalloides]